MELTQLKAAAIVPALVLASMPSATVSEKQSVELVNAQFSDTVIDHLKMVCEKDPENTIKLQPPASEWTKLMARRFEELAIKEAVGDISFEEIRELDALTRDRRNLQHPRTPEEVMWEYRQRQITSKLLDVVREYAEFHSAHPQRKRA